MLALWGRHATLLAEDSEVLSGARVTREPRRRRLLIPTAARHQVGCKAPEPVAAFVILVFQRFNTGAAMQGRRPANSLDARIARREAFGDAFKMLKGRTT